MKRFLPLVVVTILAGTVAFAVTQWFRHASCPDEKTWLRTEFALSDAQIAAIQKIRKDYEPTCASHCGKISAAKQKLAAAEKTGGPSSADYLNARAEFDALSRACAESTRRHLEAIAAQMPAEEGRRYLEMVGPKITSASSNPSRTQ
jgi:cyclopropane fatty-acyl-phospholipid synthase-like methyltransferase